jgi:tetratricopeptide (TPR) repeat protein
VTTAIIVFLASMTAWNAFAWRNGIEWWTASIRRGGGEQSRAWQELGTENQVIGKLDVAETCYLQALELNPDLAPARRNMAWMRVRQKRYEEAYTLIKECTERTPLHRHAWEDRGKVAEMAGNTEDSESSFRRAVALEPMHWASWNFLGKTLFSRKAYTEAAKCFRIALTVHKHNSYRWNLAWALRGAGNQKESAEIMKTIPKQIAIDEHFIIPPQTKVNLLEP